MKNQGFNAHTKYRILQHADQGKNISKTCQLFGISRTTFYKWRRNYEKYGLVGLENKKPSKPLMPNKVSRSLENEILNYVINYPSDGPRRISYELRAQGLELGESGIYNVLKRNNLTRASQRRAYAKKGRLRPSSKRKPEEEFLRNLKLDQAYPGYLVVQTLDYLGSFEGFGRIYQYCFYDTNSHWGEVKLFKRKDQIDIWGFFEQKLVYLLEVFNLDIENIVSERTREFLPYFVKGDKYSRIIETYEINHVFLPIEEEEIFQGNLDFKKFLVEDFYQQLERKGRAQSFRELDDRMEDFTRDYNFSQVIRDGPQQGKTPAEVVLARAVDQGTDLETLPIWLMALINSPRKGGASG